MYKHDERRKNRIWTVITWVINQDHLKFFIKNTTIKNKKQTHKTAKTTILQHHPRYQQEHTIKPTSHKQNSYNNGHQQPHTYTTKTTLNSLLRTQLQSFLSNSLFWDLKIKAQTQKMHLELSYDDLKWTRFIRKRNTILSYYY